jgi:hypothetical protein
VIDPPGSLIVGRFAQSPLTGSATIAADISQKIQAGQVYASVRTDAFPRGEIRGQFVQDLVVIRAAKDNTLYESASGSISNGAGQHFFCGRSADGDLKRAVIKFDVSGAGIPPGSVITEAVLGLTMTRSESGQQPIALHRLNADWGEGTSDARENEGSGAEAKTGDATWQHTFFSESFWESAGGDFVADASASQTVGGRGAYQWESPTMLEDVREWFENPAENFGWLLLGDETRNRTTKRFGSRENEEAFPMLTVRYEAPPCRSALVGDLNGDCRVDFLDLALMLSNWLVDCNETPGHPACLPR